MDKLQHEMYLNSAACFEQCKWKTDKLQHEMYLNIQQQGEALHLEGINFNMRCI